MQVPLPLVSHLMRALQEEVSRLEKIGKSCGENWPNDFDPNDIGMFESMQKSLQNGDIDWGIKQGIEMSDGCSRTSFSYTASMGKSVRVTMALIPEYVQRHIDKIIETDYNLLVNFYCTYKLKQCLVHISETERHMNHALPAKNVKRLAFDALQSIERFPNRE